MRFLKRVGKRSIRIKLMLLVLLSIAGIGAITGINIYLDRMIQKDLDIGTLSQELVRDVLQVMMVEADYLYQNLPELLDEYEQVDASLHRTIEEIRGITDNPEVMEQIRGILRLDEKRQELFGRARDNIGKMNQYKTMLESTPQLNRLEAEMRALRNADNSLWKELKAAGMAVRDKALEIGRMSRETVRKSTELRSRAGIGFTLAAAAALILLSVLLYRSIIKPVKGTVSGIDIITAQVLSASNELARASQSLSEGASEQAAALEEIASAIEEMFAVSRKVVMDTENANQLMNENMEKSGQSLKSLVDLTRSMTEIESDSDRIGGIIKTIDGIAFQTNLLALNAAVEAARAGDAGSGFAVVADEVRNLAIQTTEAAKRTQDLLNATIGRVMEAAKAIKGINTDFEGIIESATIMGEKSQSISKSSRMQNRGLESINLALREMDKMTQQNAASAQESASTCQELRNHAEKMMEIVDELSALVERGNSGNPGADGNYSR